MKITIKIILLFNIFFLEAQENLQYSLIIDYDIYYNTEIPNTKKGSLFISDKLNKSLFIYGKNKDKTINEDVENNNLKIIASESVRFNYFNSINDSLFSKDKIFNNEYIIVENAKNLNWILSSDTKKLNNLLVKKALLKFRGRNYIAWYSEDYPLKFGPWKFNNLPGLILEIYDETNRYRWVVNSIQKNKEKSSINIKEVFLNTKKINIRDYVNLRYNNITNLVNESKLPRGTTVNRRKIKRNGIELIFEWEEEIKEN
jgi:GLPGLI family protein